MNSGGYVLSAVVLFGLLSACSRWDKKPTPSSPANPSNPQSLATAGTGFATKWCANLASVPTETRRTLKALVNQVPPSGDISLESCAAAVDSLAKTKKLSLRRETEPQIVPGAEIEYLDLDPLADLTFLESLTLERQGLGQDDLAVISKLTALRALHLDGNAKLTGLPPELNKLDKLLHLSLSGTAVSAESLGNSLQSLKSLTAINLSQTVLGTLPPLPKSLQQLVLKETGFLPDYRMVVTPLTALKNLNLSGTELTVFPLLPSSLESLVLDAAPILAQEALVDELIELILAGHFTDLKEIFLQYPGPAEKENPFTLLAQRLNDRCRSSGIFEAKEVKP